MDVDDFIGNAYWRSDSHVVSSAAMIQVLLLRDAAPRAQLGKDEATAVADYRNHRRCEHRWTCRSQELDEYFAWLVGTLGDFRREDRRRTSTLSPSRPLHGLWGHEAPSGRTVGSHWAGPRRGCPVPTPLASPGDHAGAELGADDREALQAYRADHETTDGLPSVAESRLTALATGRAERRPTPTTTPAARPRSLIPTLSPRRSRSTTPAA